MKDSVPENIQSPRRGPKAKTPTGKRRTSQPQVQEFQPSRIKIPADHVFLPLIQLNVFRALWLNKIMLMPLTENYIPPGTIGGILPSSQAYPGYAGLLPLSEHIPANMVPTKLQREVAHCTMTNLLPCPVLRDNMITHQGSFNQLELIEDLVGIVMDIWRPTLRKGPPNNRTKGLVLEKDAMSLKVWGDPHLIESWEVGPGFARKWPHLLRGCDDLLRSTNNWRISRLESRIEEYLVE